MRLITIKIFNRTAALILSSQCRLYTFLVLAYCSLLCVW